jgi:hypothetical protein
MTRFTSIRAFRRYHPYRTVVAVQSYRPDRRAHAAAVLISLLLLAACGTSGTSRASAKGTPRVLASEKVAPSGEPIQAFALASDDSHYARAWTKFGFRTARPVVDFGSSGVIFLSLPEGSDCPETLEAMTKDAPDRLDVSTVTPKSDCRKDATPRSIAAILPADLARSNSLTVVLDKNRGPVTRIDP